MSIPDYAERQQDAESREDEIFASVNEARRARYLATPYILECWRNGEWREYGRTYNLAHAVKIADGFAQAVRVRTGGEVVYSNRAADALEHSRRPAPLMQDRPIVYEDDGDVLFSCR